MKIKQRMVSFLVISLLALSVVSIAPIRLDSVKAQPSASLLGVISDKGVNPNTGGLYRYLNVTVGISVTEPGYFMVQSDLTNSASNATSPSAQASSYLNAGLENLTLSFYGPAINHARLDPYSLGMLSLFTNTTFLPIDYMSAPNLSLRLSRVYSYSEFDPVAVLAGKIYDKGVDTNGDGLFNYLQVGVEVNVTDAGNYTVSVYLLSSYAVGTLYNSSTVNLSPGLQIVNFSFNGALIRFSQMNFSTVDEIYLFEANQWNLNGTAISPLDWLSGASLSRTYSYTEFQILAYFTGAIKDKGVSNPGDSKFDYLEVDVQINVTEAGNYSITIDGLYGSTFNGSWVNYSDYKSGYYSVGLQFVNFTCPSQMIYASKANVTSIGNFQLWAYMGEEGWWSVDQLSNVPLSTTYNYTEFNPHAYLTGRVYDYGVDTDHDGLFDYLQTNIEVNVTEDGTYQVSLQGLAENDSNQIYDYQISNPLDLHEGIYLFNFTFYGPEIAYYGINPRSVTGVSLDELSNSSTFSGQIDYMQSIPLSTQYNCSEFDHPLDNMQLNFTVNPDGSVAINAMLNATHMYPQNTNGLVVNASARLSKANNKILGSINGNIGLPPYATIPGVGLFTMSQEQFPTNQTIADYLSQYNNGILTEKLNATSVFPPIVETQYPYNTTDFTLLGTYSNGVMHAQLSGSSTIPQELASELPFNVTDVTVKANLGSNNEFKGNVTLHIISGLPIGDILVNFEGNRSDMFFTGNVTVPYGTYEGTVVNATSVAQLISEIKSNVTGEGPSSLYNMTDGILELTNVKVTNTTILGGMGVRIDYNASIHGDFAAVIAKYINNVYFPYSNDQYYPATYAALNATLSSVDDMSFTLAYSHVQKLAQMKISFDSNIKTLWSDALELIPLNIPQNETDEINALLKLGNATAYAVQNAWLNVTYTHLDPTVQLPRLDLSMSFVENAAQLNNDTRKLIPDLLNYEYPNFPQLQNITESYLNETYATLDSCNTTIHLQNGIATFRTNFSFNGNLDEQLNAAKSYYLNLINYDYSLTNATLPAQLSLLNQTSIDINNLGVNLQYGEDNAFLNVTGIVVSPPIQWIDTFRAFKLTNFFNTTSLYGSNEPPTEFEKLKIIINGGSNSTCTVIPSISGTVPTPNEISLDGQTFIWENTTISSLRDMIFNIAYQESYQNGGTTYSVPVLSNSTISNFNFNPNNKTITFSVTGPPDTMGYCNITIPRSLLDINPQSSWVIVEDGKNILQPGNLPLQPGHYNATQNGNYTFIYLIYTHSNHTISIEGNISSVQEMQPNAIPFIMMIIGLVATLLIVTQRKKIRSLKTKSLDIANRMSNRFSQLLKK